MGTTRLQNLLSGHFALISNTQAHLPENPANINLSGQTGLIISGCA